MSQLSFFTAESVPPAVADLSGVLAASGQIVMFGSGDVQGHIQGARLSVVVDQLWRAEALAEMIREAGLVPEITRTDEDTPLVRTSVSPFVVHHRRPMDAWRGQDGALALAARAARTAGLDPGGREPGGRPLSAGS